MEMSMNNFIKFLIGISLTFLIISCNSENVDTYTISRSGVLLQDETYDVIHVYGFSDNRFVASQITDFLNKEEPNTYNYHKTNN